MMDILLKLISFILGLSVAYVFYKICIDRKNIIMTNNLNKLGDVMEVDKDVISLILKKKLLIRFNLTKIL